MKFSDLVGSWFTVLVLSLATLFVATRPVQAQTETVLYNFCLDPGCSDGINPYSSLTSDAAGNFYGTTISGGEFGQGAVFELSPNGNGGWNEAVLYNFCPLAGCTDGSSPYSSLIFDSAGNLYGTAGAGGANEDGVVFELSPMGASWTEKVLHSFANGADGANPMSGLIMDPAGNLYGTTTNGGTNGTGTVFELSPSGSNWTEQVIYSFDNNSGYDALATLTMDAAGNIFGVEPSTVFELSPNGKGGWNPTVIHTFTGAPKDGSNAEGTLVLDKTGNLYGTTISGGHNHNGGTIYELRLGKKGRWTEKILHSFGSRKDGSVPVAGIVFDAAGNIYGTTAGGGRYHYGTVYELGADDGKYKEKLLCNFNYYFGQNPYGGLIWDSVGNLYGTTEWGGSSNAGVVFEVTP
jgi:uncharacterized repeat protein (TIGR03803 family)